MRLKNQVNFLRKSYEDIKKFDIYLSLCEPEISCEVSLALKRYYTWVLKNNFKIELEDDDVLKYFSNIVKDLSYIPTSKLNYADMKKLIVAHFSLGELYIHKNNRSFAEEHFEKVIEILNNANKNDSKFFNMVQDEDDITVFELSMWSRKNLGDICSNNEKALVFYESIVSDRELLYLEKNKSIYYISKVMEDVDKAYEAAINIIKVMPDYENVGKDAVEFLRNSKFYLKALEICYNEYYKNEDIYWVNVAISCCNVDKSFNIQCLERTVKFLELLLTTQHFDEWGNLVEALYNAVKNWSTGLQNLLEYLSSTLNKINYKSIDYSNFSNCLPVLKNIYKEILDKKYENRKIRGFEEDFNFYFMMASFRNKNYNDSFEASTRLLAMKVQGSLKYDINYIEKVLKVSLENVSQNEDNVKIYPWMELINKVNFIGEKCDFNNDITYDEQCRIVNRKIKILILCEDLKRKEEFLNSMQQNIFKIGNKIESGEFVVVEDQNIDIADIAIVLLENNNIEKGIKDKISELDYKNTSKFLWIVSSDIPDAEVEETKEILKNKGILSHEEIYKESDVEDIYNKIEESVPNSITMYRYNDFSNLVKKHLKDMDKETEREFLEKGLEVQSVEDSTFKYEEDLKIIKNNIEDFKDKINNDLESLKDYVGNKIDTVVPAIIDSNSRIVDTIEEGKNLRDEAEGAISNKIVDWCNEEIIDMLKNQFNMFLNKYDKVYFSQLDLIRSTNNNTRKIKPIALEFADDIKEVNFISEDDLKIKINNYYEEFLENLDFKFKMFPRKNIIKSIATGLSGIFSKQGDKISNKKELVKAELIEESDIVCDNIYNKIFDKLEELTLKIHMEIDDIFKELIDDIEKNILTSKKIFETKKIERNGLETRNKEIVINISFINSELEKYKKQLLLGVLYCNGTVYKI